MAEVDASHPHDPSCGIWAVEDPPGSAEFVLPLRQHAIADAFSIEWRPQAVRPTGIVRAVEGPSAKSFAHACHQVRRAADR
ncbi:MAG TPA: hypothetical protein VLM76_09520 [Patescibacteria group bacterium]|nr:hypothetical protein [Patescibacteria group bacterium]